MGAHGRLSQHAIMGLEANPGSGVAEVTTTMRWGDLAATPLDHRS